jgi:hypothetical protein
VLAVSRVCCATGALSPLSEDERDVLAVGYFSTALLCSGLRGRELLIAVINDAAYAVPTVYINEHRYNI